MQIRMTDKMAPRNIASPCHLALIVIVLFCAPSVCAEPSAAQNNPLAGKWSGFFSGVTLNLILGPDFTYSQQNINGPLQTSESGNYRLFPQNVIVFEVLDWYPKTNQVYHPIIGTPNGYYTQDPVGPPQGGSYSYIYNPPNSLMLTDLNTHASVLFTRMR